jgi:Bacterial PH domain
VSIFAPNLPLPGPLPAGELILWRGRPQWRGLALRAFRVRQVAIYFGLLAIWRVALDISAGDGIAAIAMTILWLLVPCSVACGVLLLLAWLSSRTTQYTVTSRRVIIQFGIALPMTLNVPFRVMGAAALRSYADGSGDIPIEIAGGDRVAYLMLWPHVRPWRAARAEPMLRSIDDAKHVAEILARAVVAAPNATDSIATLVAERTIVNGARIQTQTAATVA